MASFRVRECLTFSLDPGEYVFGLEPSPEHLVKASKNIRCSAKCELSIPIIVLAKMSGDLSFNGHTNSPAKGLAQYGYISRGLQVWKITLTARKGPWFLVRW